MAYATVLSWLATVLLAIASLVAVKLASLLYFRFKYKRLLSSFPDHPNGVPFFGHADAVSLNMHLVHVVIIII